MFCFWNFVLLLRYIVESRKKQQIKRNNEIWIVIWAPSSWRRTKEKKNATSQIDRINEIKPFVSKANVRYLNEIDNSNSFFSLSLISYETNKKKEQYDTFIYTFTLQIHTYNYKVLMFNSKIKCNSVARKEKTTKYFLHIHCCWNQMNHMG